MNTNIYERKEFLNGPIITNDSAKMFTNFVKQNRTIVKVNLIRATANEAEFFKNHLFGLEDNNTPSIIIDLSDCNFIDSTFLSSILSFTKNNNIKVDLVVADERQMTIFRITKLDKIFNIYQSLDKAIAA